MKYRKLKLDEVIKKGDEFKSPLDNGWILSKCIGDTPRKYGWDYRRPIIKKSKVKK